MQDSGVPNVESVQAELDRLYREESRRILASLIRLLGDFDRAEEAMHEAFAAAAAQWPEASLPTNPRAWLISTGRFRAIDGIRHRARWEASLEAVPEPPDPSILPADPEFTEDERLRLIFTCCHPALHPDQQIALTLRTVCGLRTEEIARAFLAAAPAIAQRIVRAKAKIREARIPFEIPGRAELPERLDAVLHVVYFIFNEGYAASEGDTFARPDLSAEAIRLGRLLLVLLPDPEVMGLLALMLLHESRRPARRGPEGEVILLEDQDRSLWNRDHIEKGLAGAERALSSGRIGPYAIQAAIAALHAEAATSPDTDWAQIVALYDLLFRMEPSPVVALNRAVAVAMRDGAQAGVDLIEGLLARGDLADYALAHAALADLHRRLGHTHEARVAYTRALALTRQAPERVFLQGRLERLEA